MHNMANKWSKLYRNPKWIGSRVLTSGPIENLKTLRAMRNSKVTINLQESYRRRTLEIPASTEQHRQSEVRLHCAPHSSLEHTEQTIHQHTLSKNVHSPTINTTAESYISCCERSYKSLQEVIERAPIYKAPGRILFWETLRTVPTLHAKFFAALWNTCGRFWMMQKHI